MTAVMIGVDPHKASHTAVAISGSEEPLGEQISDAIFARLRADARSAPAQVRDPGGQ
jgi:hypothetical protein